MVAGRGPEHSHPPEVVIETFAGGDPDFPRTSTGRQQYNEFDFEAYRALGSYAVREMLAWIRTPQTTATAALPPC
jgi:hypothetical protein